MTPEEIFLRNARKWLYQEVRKQLRCGSVSLPTKTNCLSLGHQHGPKMAIGSAMDELQRHWIFAVQKILNAAVRKAERQSSVLLPLLMMPPTRRKNTPKGPTLTLVETRARRAKERLAQWQRKSKLAATKIRKYRRQVNYYKKKGLVK